MINDPGLGLSKIPKKKSALKGTSKDPLRLINNEEFRSNHIKNFCQYLPERNFHFSKIRLLHNSELSEKFSAKQKEFNKDRNMSQKMCNTGFAFLQIYGENQMLDILKNGFENYRHQNLLCERQALLGDPEQGIHLSANLDTISPLQPVHGAKGMAIMFKIMKGKIKTMSLGNRDGEPTGEHDSHEPPPSLDKSPQQLCYHSRIYLYDYRGTNDGIETETVMPPRNVLPYAVFNWQYLDDKNIRKPPAFNGTCWSGQIQAPQSGEDDKQLLGSFVMKVGSSKILKPAFLGKTLIIDYLIQLEECLADREFPLQDLINHNGLKVWMTRSGPPVPLKGNFWVHYARLEPRAAGGALEKFTADCRELDVIGQVNLPKFTTCLIFPPGDLSSLLGLNQLVTDPPSFLHMLVFTYREPSKVVLDFDPALVKAFPELRRKQQEKPAPVIGNSPEMVASFSAIFKQFHLEDMEERRKKLAPNQGQQTSDQNDTGELLPPQLAKKQPVSILKKGGWMPELPSSQTTPVSESSQEPANQETTTPNETTPDIATPEPARPPAPPPTAATPLFSEAPVFSESSADPRVRARQGRKRQEERRVENDDSEDLLINFDVIYKRMDILSEAKQREQEANRSEVDSSSQDQEHESQQPPTDIQSLYQSLIDSEEIPPLNRIQDAVDEESSRPAEEIDGDEEDREPEAPESPDAVENYAEHIEREPILIRTESDLYDDSQLEARRIASVAEEAQLANRPPPLAVLNTDGTVEFIKEEPNTEESQDAEIGASQKKADERTYSAADRIEAEIGTDESVYFPLEHTWPPRDASDQDLRLYNRGATDIDMRSRAPIVDEEHVPPPAASKQQQYYSDESSDSEDYLTPDEIERKRYKRSTKREANKRRRKRGDKRSYQSLGELDWVHGDGPFPHKSIKIDIDQKPDIKDNWHKRQQTQRSSLPQLSPRRDRGSPPRRSTPQDSRRPESQTSSRDSRERYRDLDDDDERSRKDTRARHHRDTRRSSPMESWRDTRRDSRYPPDGRLSPESQRATDGWDRTIHSRTHLAAASTSSPGPSSQHPLPYGIQGSRQGDSPPYASSTPTTQRHHHRRSPTQERQNTYVPPDPLPEMPAFGIVIPDEVIFFKTEPEKLEEVLGVWATRAFDANNPTSSPWCMKIHSQLVCQISNRINQLDPISEPAKKLQRFLQIMRTHKQTGIIELMDNHECDTKPRSAGEYFSCLKIQQILLRRKHPETTAKLIFLSNISRNSEVGQSFTAQGIEIMNMQELCDFFAPWEMKPRI